MDVGPGFPAYVCNTAEMFSNLELGGPYNWMEKLEAVRMVVFSRPETCRARYYVTQTEMVPRALRDLRCSVGYIYEA